MSCNIRIPLQQIIDDVAAALSDGFIKTDNAVLTEAVLNEVTIRGDISVDTAARNALCAILQSCGITAIELEWLDRPTVADMVVVSEVVAGEVVVSWKDLDSLVPSQEEINTYIRNELDALPFEEGVLADTFVVKTANGVGQVARTQRDVNSSVIYPEDYGAIGDGNVHTLQEWIDSGRYASLSDIQADFPKVISLDEYIDKVAIQAAVDYAKSVSGLVKGMPGASYYIDSTVVIDHDCDFRGTTLYFDAANNGVAVRVSSTSSVLTTNKIIKLPDIYAKDRVMGEDWTVGNIGVQLTHIIDSVIEFGVIYGFETNLHLYVDSLSASDTNRVVCYNSFFFSSTVGAAKTNIKIERRGKGYINECKWYNGRFTSYSSDTQYLESQMINLEILSEIVGHNPPNGHTFNGMCFEGNFNYTIFTECGSAQNRNLFGSNNRWMNCRFEASKRIHLDSRGLHDTFYGCMMHDDVQITGAIPNMGACPTQGRYSIKGADGLGSTRLAGKVHHTFCTGSGSDMLASHGVVGRINNAFTADGNLNIFNATDDSKLQPSLTVGRKANRFGLFFGNGTDEPVDSITYYTAGQAHSTMSLTPRDDNTVDLGQANQKWRRVYAHNIHTAGSIQLWGKTPTLSGQPKLSGDYSQSSSVKSIAKILHDYGILDYTLAKDSLQSGDTSQRPTGVEIGFRYFDTTLVKPVYWSGSKWVDAMGSDV